MLSETRKIGDFINTALRQCHQYEAARQAGAEIIPSEDSGAHRAPAQDEDPEAFTVRPVDALRVREREIISAMLL